MLGGSAVRGSLHDVLNAALSFARDNSTTELQEVE